MPTEKIVVRLMPIVGEIGTEADLLDSGATRLVLCFGPLATGFNRLANEESTRAAGTKAYLMKLLTKKEVATPDRNILD